MMKERRNLLLLIFLCLFVAHCADEKPFLTGYIKRAFDAAMMPCDPYNKGDLHTCVVFSSAFNQSLIIYDATVEELVLAPMRYFPLKVKVGPATNALAKVKNTEEKFPYFLALDPVLPSLYVVRAFPGENKKSFETPLKQSLPTMATKPYKIAAMLSENHVVLIVSYPDSASVQIIGLDAKSGLIDSALSKAVNIGTKPSHIEIVDERALISDSGSNEIHAIDLRDIEDVWQGKKPLLTKSHNIGMKSDR
ncbi:MAG TPA: hypothetical protein VEK06_05385, partial [Myxococcota bacterium]|nr:hypothetical protein [Myxococcota bacterium]